ncbi:hypothetical protein AWB98_06640 [Mycolicibacterium conceptionense]|uniref:Tape measure protein n=2 Tax=Mycolicibacterium conceptionense TaxID=451644 RepID=A0ABX3VDY9_9MYCO|nr:tape measure protein [Mycolicibacterium conceptionense]ORV29062.1 hypothetical protein AWB98_06640 [Mycolicibacterium conceptionense]
MPETSRMSAGVNRLASDAERRFGRSGQVMGAHMARGIDQGSSRAVQALKAVEKQQGLVTKAAAKNADAQGRVRVAMAALEDINRKSSVTTRQRVSAEEMLARAHRNQRTAASELTRQTRMLHTAQQEVRRAGPVGATAFRTSFAGIRSDASGTGRSIETALGGGMSRAAQFGGRAMSMAVKTATAGLATLGLGGSFAGVQMITGGLDRLSTMQDATVAMTTLLGDQAEAQRVVNQVTDAAQGTPFAADQFLNMARTMTAMQVPAADIEGHITAIANAVAASGKGAGALDQLALIFGKISAQGKIQGDEALSLMEAGVPALQILANSFNMTTAEMQKMISKGEVDAPRALAALTDGIMNGSDGVAGQTRAFGGVMEELRKTYTGAKEVFKAQRKILGAEFIKPLFDRLPDGLNTISDYMKSLRPGAAELGTNLADGIERFITWVQSPATQQGIGVFKSGLADMVSAGREVAPGLMAASKTAATMFGTSAISAWKLAAETLKLLAPLINSLGNFAASNQGAVNALGMAIGALYIKGRLLGPTLTAANAASRVWGGTVGALRAPLRDVTDRTTGLVTQTGLLTRAQQGALGPVGQMRLAYLHGAQQASRFARSQEILTPAARQLRDQMMGQLGPLARVRQGVSDTTTKLRGMQTVMGGMRAAGSGMSMAASGLMGALGGPWGLAITGATVAIGALGAAHADAAAKAAELRQREIELQNTLDATTGKVTQETREKIAERFDDADAYKGNSIFKRASEFGVSEKDLVDASIGNDTAYGEVRERADAAINRALDSNRRASAMVEELANMGVSREEVLNALSKEGAGWDIVNQKIEEHNNAQRAAGDSGAPVINSLGQLVKVLPDVAESWTVITQAINEERRETTKGMEARKRQTAGVHGLWKETEEATKRFADLGAKILEVPTDTEIVVDVLDEEARATLEELGYTVRDIDGTVKVTADTDEAKNRMKELVTEIDSTTARLTLDIDTRRAYDALNGLQGMIAGIESGDIGASPDAQRILDSLPPLTPRARGAVDVWGSVSSYANGKLPSTAVIQHPVGRRGLVQWAEPSTHGEAFIPLAPSNRARSQAIWEETGRRLGMMRSYAQGGLNPGTAYVKDLIAQMFPVGDIGGWRPEDGYGEHSSGNAIDVMIPNWNTPQGKAVGDAVAAWALQNAQALGLTHVLWQQRSFGPGDRTGSPMEDRGSPTQNHYDHVHLFMNQNGGQLPTAPLMPPGGTYSGTGRLSGSGASKVRDAENRLADAEGDVREKQARLAEVQADADAKESQRISAEEDLAKARRDRDTAAAELADARNAPADDTRDGRSGGVDGQSFGRDMLSGALEAIGLDGEIFSDPTQWGIWKLGAGLLNYGGGLLKGALGGPAQGNLWGPPNQHGMGGYPGPGNSVGDGGLGDIAFNDPGSPVGNTLSTWLPNVSDFLPNSQSGKTGDNITTNQNTNSHNTTGTAYNGPISVTNNYGAGQQPRGNTLTSGLPKV